MSLFLFVRQHPFLHLCYNNELTLSFCYVLLSQTLLYAPGVSKVLRMKPFHLTANTFFSNEKIIIYETFVDFIECNISRNNHII